MGAVIGRGMRKQEESGAFLRGAPESRPAPKKKQCWVCGADVAQGWRYKDAHWNYWCRECRQDEQRSARRAALRRKTAAVIVAIVVAAIVFALWILS